MSIEKIDGCIGCGTCVRTCPMDVVRLRLAWVKIRRGRDGRMELLKHDIRNVG